MFTSSACSEDAFILPQRCVTHLQGELAGFCHSCSRTYIPRPAMLTVRVTKQVRFKILHSNDKLLMRKRTSLTPTGCD